MEIYILGEIMQIKLLIDLDIQEVDRNFNRFPVITGLSKKKSKMYDDDSTDGKRFYKIL